jgi:carboxymethylenebutenolidase
MKTKMMDIKTPDGICDVFIAYPQDPGPYPAVLFLMDGFGPRAWLYEMAKTIAERGYYVLLPNMFYRIGPVPFVDIKFPVRAEDMPEVGKKLMSLFQTYSPEYGVKDIGCFLDFFPGKKRCNQARSA